MNQLKQRVALKWAACGFKTKLTVPTYSYSVIKWNQSSLVWIVMDEDNRFIA